MTDKVGSIESERLSSYYTKTWCNDAVPRYFYAKVSHTCT